VSQGSQNDVDILADFTLTNLDQFLGNLPATFFADAEEARNAIRLGRAFNLHARRVQVRPVSGALISRSA
jgi:hypothetical protein